MTKNTNKSQREIPVAEESANHRKKSNKKYLSRSKHKHEYSTVHLHCTIRNFEGKYVDFDTATKVCTICGRVGKTDKDYYEKGAGAYLGFHPIEEKIAKLEDWSMKEPFAKFATKGWQGVKEP